jgi:hypothetical protein
VALRRTVARRSTVVAAAALPLLLGTLPAGAAQDGDDVSESLGFVTLSDQLVSCQLQGHGFHDTERDGGYAFGSSVTENRPECQGFLAITLAYDDAAGGHHRNTASGDARTLSLESFGAVSAITITHSIELSACDANRSPNGCRIQFDTRPK